MRALAITTALVALLLAPPARAEAPLQLQGKIVLPDIIGRIDHLAFDSAHRRVFVAELGNDSVGVVDLAQQKLVRRLLHLKEPRGVGYVPASDTLYVASALDGVLRVFHGAALTADAPIPLGPRLDDIRVDDAARLVYVGYGSGAIAVIDDRTHKPGAEIKLREHPENFALAEGGKRMFVSVPAAQQVAVLDLAAGKVAATWLLHDGRDNVALGLDDDRVVTVFRRPPQLAALSTKDGRTLATLPACVDADDLFVDPPRHRLYVICGEGKVDVLEWRDASYARLGEVPTGPGARTGLFIPELGELIVAVPATPASAVTEAAPPNPAALFVFKP